MVVARRIWRCGTQAGSPVSVLTVNAALTPPQRLLRASLTSSVSILMVGTGKTVQAILVAVFLVLIPSSPMSSVSSYLSLSATMPVRE